MAFRADMVLEIDTLFGLGGALSLYGPAQALTYYFQSDSIIPENRRH
jgi:hypothetical protein